MKNATNTAAVEHRARLAALLVFITVIIGLAAAAVGYALTSEPPRMLAKEEILERIELVNAESDHNFVASYLTDYGIAGFDTKKLRTCELYFTRYTIYEMKDTEALATECATLFCEYVYDRVDRGSKAALTDAVLECYVEATGDGYAVYRNAEQYLEYNTDMSGSFVGIGIQVQYNREKNTITVIDVYEGSGAMQAGIAVGDLIVGVDGKTLEGVGYDALVSGIRGEEGTTVTVTVKRGELTLDLVATRRQVVEKTVRYTLRPDGIAYIKITGFKENTFELFTLALDAAEDDSARGVIFDMRNNPGGYLNTVVDMIDYIAPEGQRIASYKYSTDVKETVFVSDDGHSVDLPFVVMMNGGTASAGELFSAALRDYGKTGVLDVTTVGTKSYSKGVMQSTIGFSDKSTLTLTVAYYNPPSNVNYDGIGITPDVVVELEEGSDAQLDAAVIEMEKLLGSAA